MADLERLVDDNSFETFSIGPFYCTASPTWGDGEGPDEIALRVYLGENQEWAKQYQQPVTLGEIVKDAQTWAYQCLQGWKDQIANPDF